MYGDDVVVNDDDVLAIVVVLYFSIRKTSWKGVKIDARTTERRRTSIHIFSSSGWLVFEIAEAYIVIVI